MSGNTLGTLFTVTTFGESHGPAMGCVIDGCPPGLALNAADCAIDSQYRRAQCGDPAKSLSQSRAMGLPPRCRGGGPQKKGRNAAIVLSAAPDPKKPGQAMP